MRNQNFCARRRSRRRGIAALLGAGGEASLRATPRTQAAARRQSPATVGRGESELRPGALEKNAKNAKKVVNDFSNCSARKAQPARNISSCILQSFRHKVACLQFRSIDGRPTMGVRHRLGVRHRSSSGKI